jgi:hypothetical protein
MRGDRMVIIVLMACVASCVRAHGVCRTMVECLSRLWHILESDDVFGYVKHVCVHVLVSFGLSQVVVKSSTFGRRRWRMSCARCSRPKQNGSHVKQRYATGEARVARSAIHMWQQLVVNERVWSCGMLHERLSRENVRTCARRLLAWALRRRRL